MTPTSRSGLRDRRFWLQRLGADALDFAQYLLLVAGIIWLAFQGAAAMGYNWQWYRVPAYIYRYVDGAIIPGPLIKGLGVTLQVSGLAIIIALAIGSLTAALRMGKSPFGRAIAGIYLEVIRNTPLLVQIFLAYFVASPILGISRFWTGVLALAIFEGAFASEIIRAGLLSVPKNQHEAAKSLGLNDMDRFRFVIVPQALRIMLPPMAGVLVNLIKHSSIVSVIAVFDLTNEARNIISDTFISFEIWLTVALFYLALTLPMSAAIGILERRFRLPS